MSYVASEQAAANIDETVFDRSGYAGAKMYPSLFLNAPDPMLLVEATGAINEANHAAAEAFGYSRTRLRGLTLDDLGDGRLDGRFNARYRRENGTHFACEVNAARLPEGEILCVLRMLEPRAAEDLYAQSFRKSPVFVSVVNLSDNKFVDVNDAWCLSTGFAREQVIGKTFVDLGIKLSTDDLLKVARAALSEDSTPLELQTTTPNGRVNTALQTHQFANFDGKRCVIAYGIDISAQKRLEGELRHAHKMEAVGRLASGVAHDFNNILTAIHGQAELLLASGDPAHMHRHAEKVRAAAMRGSSLTGQLLTFARKQILQPRVLDLSALVGSLTKMLKRIIGDEIELAAELATDPVCVKADLGQLEQVVLNLALNARDAMPDGGRLTLRTSRRDETAVLEVTDTGVGMDESVRARLFEPFFTTKTDGRGTGLGLPTVDDIVTRSGGRIEVDTAPGAGSTFRVVLPRVDDAPDREARPQMRALIKGNETLLLVENDHDVRAFLQDALDAQGYRVLVASDGHEALRLAAENAQPIHLLISDVLMPRMNGGELASRLQVLRPHVRALFITGYPGDALANKGYAGPAPRVLQKPFTIDHLAQSVREILDHRAG